MCQLDFLICLLLNNMVVMRNQMGDHWELLIPVKRFCVTVGQLETKRKKKALILALKRKSQCLELTSTYLKEARSV